MKKILFAFEDEVQLLAKISQYMYLNLLLNLKTVNHKKMTKQMTYTLLYLWSNKLSVPRDMLIVECVEIPRLSEGAKGSSLGHFY